MFEKLRQAAEQTAAGVSRRQFLGWLGAGAAALAASVGGLMAHRALASGIRSAGTDLALGCPKLEVRPLPVPQPSNHSGRPSRARNPVRTRSAWCRAACSRRVVARTPGSRKLTA